MEKSIARTSLMKNVEETWGVRKPNHPDAAWKVLSSGPEHKKWRIAAH
jgi:hypothetical protein